MNKLLKFLRKPSKPEKFEQWISLYHGDLYKHALWMTGNQDLAQEMTQETFFQAWLGMGALKEDAKALPWLLTILRRCVYREQRHQYRHRETMEMLSLQSQGRTHDVNELLQIYDAMERLSAKLRHTFLLHHLHGFSYEEISDQLQIPMGTVMSRLSRAREALQAQHLADEKIIDFKKAQLSNEA